MLRDQPLKPHPAGSLEQVGADLALLEGRHENALGPARGGAAPDLSCAGAAAAGKIVAAERQAVEGIELDLVVVLARVKGVEVGDPVDPSTTASPSMMNWVFRIFRAVSTIHGYRLVQSCPPLENSRTRSPSRSTRSR